MFRLLASLFLALVMVCHNAYAINAKIEGIDDSKLLQNMQVYLQLVAAPVACELSDNYKKTLKQKITEASQSLGYYSTSLIFVELEEGACDTLKLNIRQGQQTLITTRNVVLSGEGKEAPEFIAQLKTLPLKLGAPLNHDVYESSKRRLESVAQNYGYFDARYTEKKVSVDRQTHMADVQLHFDTGKRYRFGKLLLVGDEKNQEIVNQLRPFTEGQAYHADLLAVFNRDLKLTGFFNQVLARPLVADAINHQVPIEVLVTDKPRDTYNIGGGVSTDTGARARFKWQRSRVNTAGHSMSSELFVSAPLQTISFRYKIPIEDPLENYLSLQAGFRAEDDNDTKSATTSLAVQRHWGGLESKWNKIGFLRFEREVFTQGDALEQSTNLLIPGATLSRHRSEGGLDVNWGDKQQFTLEASSKDLLSDIDLVRLTVQSLWLRSFGEHRWLLRTELGAIYTNDFSRVPASLRYFAGGDQSIRGFSYQSLSPIENDKLIGGQYLNLASLEYTYPIYPDWRLALFTDAGNASEEPLQDIAYSVGTGISWLTPVGPIRLYLARGRSVFESTWRIHFSMGPAI